MKKLLVIILALVFALSLCACANESGEPDSTQAKGTEAPSAAEPEVTEEPPIEISEFGPEEDMPAPFADEVPREDFHGTEYLVNGYNPEWLYYHNIYDWRQAGITYDQIDEIADSVLSLPFNDDALAAFKVKISEFTLIMMLEAPADINTSAPSITLDDDIYDVAWLSSHNATEYKEAGIPAATVKEYLDALHENFWYTYEYRWIEEVYSRLTK